MSSARPHAPEEKLKVAILASGGGTNLEAILGACDEGTIHARVVAVVSNKPDARALVRAANHGVPALVVDHRGFPSREAHEREILRRLEPYGPELVALAGYMRLVTPFLIESLRNRKRGLPGVVNIHPADTKAYQGEHGYEFALGMLPQHPARLAETRITVHFVDSGMDTGPVIAQRTLEVLPGDTLDSLKERGLAIEHALYPEVIDLYARGRLSLTGGRVEILDDNS